ncbi:MAG: 16S rRNA (uracil(1498)-N(3))-methyltransferase [Oscillospiraceae bacterium]|nr:16S rRNA (uracil(1498)-N(3))-methyltransferase [Oscillospiraceae bacterium]
MPRFFIEPFDGETACLAGEDAAHISRSLRLRPGEAVTLCDGAGTDYDGELLAVGETVTVKILARRPNESEPRLRVTLYQAVPKGDKLETIIQKAVELGAAAIVPMLTERCVARPDGKAMAKKLPRYQKIALEAAKQCGRGIVPKVLPMVTLKEAAASLAGKSLLLYEGGGQRLCELVNGEEEALNLFVGSEGGFSPEEVGILRQAGARPATLGKRILRCETAPLCGLSVIFALAGDI